MNRSKDPQTLQAKFGFADADLKTATHDEIMLWLDKNALTICTGLLPGWSPSHAAEHVTRLSAKFLAESEALIAKARQIPPTTGKWSHPTEEELAFVQTGAYNLEIPPFECAEMGICTWEYPIVTGTMNKYTVGFIDMKITLYHDPYLALEGAVTNQAAGICYFTAPPSIRMGFNKRERFLFEVKTSIPSLGELIRQIRYYQNYLSGNYVIVSPDTRWREAIEAQRIYFVAVDLAGNK